MSKPPHGKLEPLIYATIYGGLQQIAYDNGYSLAVHGSMQRDFDLIAIPWTDQSIDGEELIDKFAESLHSTRSEPTLKPHGRIAYFIILGCGMGVDVSIMPRILTDTSNQEMNL